MKRKIFDREFILICLFISILIFISAINIVGAVGTYPTVDPSMVLYYHFNNQSAYGENDTFVYDFSGNGNNGSVINYPNSSFTKNFSYLNDGSFNFTGFNGYIQTNHINATNGFNWSVSAWFYPNQSGKVILSQSYYHKDGWYIQTSNSQLLVYFNNATGDTQRITHSSAFQYNKWNFLTLVVENSTSVKIYVNGVDQSNDQNFMLTPIINYSRNFKIGSFDFPGAFFYNGSIDEVIVWNRTLSSKEVLNLYNTYHGCYDPVSDVRTDITSDLDMCNTIYYVNQSIGNYLYRFLSDNITVNCNNATFIGNMSGSIFYVNGYRNILVKNCNFKNYYSTFSIVDNTINFSIFNSSFINIFNNAIYIQRANYTSITYSYFYNSTQGSSQTGDFIAFNDVKGDINISYNTFNKSSRVFLFDGRWNQTNFNFTFSNNIIDDMSGNGDSYNVGIQFIRYRNGGNTTINNNNFTRIGCVGILTQGANNLNIYNNLIQSDYLTNILKLTNCAYEVPTAIDLASIWKTWTTDSSENISDNITKMLRYSASNINIYNNTIIGFPVLLRACQTVNLTHDLSNFWFRSFATPNYLMPRQDYYISNNYNNLTTTFALVNNDPVILRDILGVGYPGFSTSSNKLFFKVYRNYYWFQNNFSITGVYQNVSQGISLFNVSSNSLLFFSNGTGLMISGDYNNSLDYGNTSIVLLNFNLTEGISRDFSPIWFSSSSNSEKHIASNLTNSVDVLVITDLGDCDTKNYIKYTTDSGIITEWKGQAAHDICNQLKTIGLTLSIEPALNSNIISWINGTTNVSSSILKSLILILGIILLVGVLSIFYLYSKNNFQEVSIEQFIKAVIVFIILEILIIALMTYISDIV